LFKKKEEEAAENGEEVTANQVDEIIETTAEPEVLVAEDGIETTEDPAGTLETTYGALGAAPIMETFAPTYGYGGSISAALPMTTMAAPPDDSFTSMSIPFVANGPFAASRSIPLGGSTQGFTSRFSPGGFTSGYTSGYSGFGATPRGVTSGYTSGCSGFGANTRGFTSTVASSNASSYAIPFKASTPIIPFKANTPSYSASPVTSASPATIPFKANTPSYSTTPTTTLGSSYATPMKSSGPPVGNGAGASTFRNITAQRDSQLQTSINNATTLRTW